MAAALRTSTTAGAAAAALVLLLLSCGADAGRSLCASHAGGAAAAAAAPSYPTVGAALAAAANAEPLKTLVAALQAANLTIPTNATWTLFAPVNEAFADPAIQATVGLNASQLLDPAYKDALIKVLSYHVVPSAAVASSQLRDGQRLQTLLSNSSLTVSLPSGGKQVLIQAGSGGNATVVTPDIKAGGSIIHVIDRVLIPASLVKA